MKTNKYTYEAIGYVKSESELKTLVDTEQTLKTLWPSLEDQAMVLEITGFDRVYVEADEGQDESDECKVFVHVDLIGKRKEVENEAPTQAMADFLDRVSTAICVNEVGETVLVAEDWEVLAIEMI